MQGWGGTGSPPPLRPFALAAAPPFRNGRCGVSIDRALFWERSRGPARCVVVPHLATFARGGRCPHCTLIPTRRHPPSPPPHGLS